MVLHLLQMDWGLPTIEIALHDKLALHGNALCSCASRTIQGEARGGGGGGRGGGMHQIMAGVAIDLQKLPVAALASIQQRTVPSMAACTNEAD